MKIHKFFIGVGLSCALVLSSCEKVIEVEPEFQKDGSQIFNKLEDYEFALTGAYALFRATGYFGNGGQTTGSWSTLPEMMGEGLVRTAEDLANFQTSTNWVYTADEDDINVSWLAAYSVIAQANLVLRNIDKLATNEAETKRVNRVKGQALAIRGMAHFDVLRYWGVNFDRNSTALGVPYVTAVDIENKPARLTVKESYDNIFKDLEQAEGLLGNVDKAINTGTSRANIDQLATRALLARVNLYAKDYVKAESYATMVIDARPLASKTVFPGIWTDATQTEVIWTVPFSAGEGSPSINIHIGSSNRNRYRPSSTIENMFDKATDVRFPAYFAGRPTGAGAAITPGVSTSTRRIVNKYMGRNGAVDNLVNWKVLRTGEMYLIRAEARALQGATKLVGALADLNTLRDARINNYVPVVLVGQDLVNAIAAERQKELFLEGHRWFDLKRTTRSLTRTDCGTANTCTLAPTAREWVWPIPTGELDANPNIKGQQSPGY